MEKRKFTKEDFDLVKHLEKQDYINKVTEKTVEGIYNFRGVDNVAIWNVRVVMTGKKQIKREIIFNFCIGSYNLKEGGEYYADAYSRNLRKITDTEDKDRCRTK